jgi:hypothetical protein
VGDVHELELRIRRERLLQGRVDIAGLLLQVVTSPLPRGDEVLRVGRGHLESVDEGHGFGTPLAMAVSPEG